MDEPHRLDWLLEGDPSIRWRILRDLQGADPAEVADERRRVGTHGWGRRLLDLQAPSGMWSEDLGPRSHRGLYMPKWISTHYTLLLLARLGLEPGHPQAVAGCRALLERATWLPTGGLKLWTVHVTDVCVCAMVLSFLQAFEVEQDAQQRLRSFLLEVQLPDGGWNCERDSAHGSFHTTLSTLEALSAGPRSPAVDRAIHLGNDFFLAHHLYCSHRTGAVARPAFTKFPIPHSWRFDALRGLGHFARTDTPRDERLSGAMGLLCSRQRPDGRWTVNARASGQVHFELERAGRPSRWVTLHALRILRWWHT